MDGGSLSPVSLDSPVLPLLELQYIVSKRVLYQWTVASWDLDLAVLLPLVLVVYIVCVVCLEQGRELLVCCCVMDSGSLGLRLARTSCVGV